MQESNYQKIRKGVENANDFDITITITGNFLIKNNLVEVWKIQRGISSHQIIDNEYSDTISIYQAEALGIIEKL